MWTKEQSWDWYKAQPWIVGCNYLPRTAVNSTEMWQKDTFDGTVIKQELEIASQVGYNTCRVFLQYMLWKADEEALFDCFDEFLDIASGCGMKVMPVLFDDCAFAKKEPYLGIQAPPVPGIHNSGWTPSPGFQNADKEAEQELLKCYVQEFVGRYKEDLRILLWDLYNEPGNSGRRSKSVPLLRQAFAWTRECRPTQPLTAGVWNYKDYDLIGAELSDIVTFHDYRNMEETKRCVNEMEAYGRPVICTEWLHRPNNNRFETHLAYYKEKRIGVVNWGLAAGKTQTYYNWDASKNPKEGKPQVWQHDLFYEDLTPYCQKELEFLTSVVKSDL